MDCDETKPNEM
jgi:hypothetical protein